MIRLAPQVPRHVVEGDDLHAAAAVLQRAHDLNEVTVAGAEHDAVEMLGLQQAVHRHVQVRVGLGPLDAAVVGEVLDLLLDNLEAGVTDRRVVLEHRFAVLAIGLRAPFVEGDVGVQPDGLPVLAAGDVAQHAVLHPVAPVAAQVLGVHIHAHAQSRISHVF